MTENEKENEELETDTHNCSINSDIEGYCKICGAAIPGTKAYRDLYGGE